jgi:hypothetical protein
MQMPDNPSTRGMSATPFKAPQIFQQFGIDWTQDAATEPERSLREAFLTHETSCGPNGLVSILLLAMVPVAKEQWRKTFRLQRTTPKCFY